MAALRVVEFDSLAGFSSFLFLETRSPLSRLGIISQREVGVGNVQPEHIQKVKSECRFIWLDFLNAENRANPNPD
jgi:hypothetical protein